ncbi:uncharacterized protein LOC131690940 [Topomyia yanbarensis]|uniref:uncharacterized protein LOC131690940 n=1 Tax=Topomyia yanbarensis TaxID=2498891 RepID=UPI00273A7C3B|nr:uncharacterized protein LOC131690940 [Topomyia yanbarensis]
MWASHWIYLGVLLLSQLYRSQCLNNQCGIPMGSGTIATKCTGCKSLIICVRDLTTFESGCDQNEYCMDIPGYPGNAVCSTMLPSGCTADSTTTTSTTTAATTTEVTTTESNPVTRPSNDQAAIQCTGSGIYPDPTNCFIYHYCSASNEDSTVQVCPPGYSFYHGAASIGVFPCKLDTVCDVVDCSGTATVVPYGTSETFFAICHGSDGGSAAMMKCSDGAAFDGVECVFSCTGEGMFANTVDSSVYYKCYFSGTELVSTLEYCPANKVFNDVIKVCVSK